MPELASITTVQSAITDEIFFALGLNRRGFLRRSLGWIFALPARRFAYFMTSVDTAMAKGGSPAGCRVMMNMLQVQIDTRGVENIPVDGPVMILANHPGAYDSMAIGSLVPRTDLKAIVSATRLYDSLPNLRPNVFFVGKDAGENMQTLREAIDYLRGGGLVLQFGSGKIEPDPATDPVGDEIFERWSPSVEIMLRKVPGLRVVPTISSGVLLPRFRNHPFVKLRKGAIDRRRLAEFMQIIQQLMLPKSVKAQAQISFGKPFGLEELEAVNGARRLMPAVIERVKAQLAEHLVWIGK
jgi:hypothetical protein